MKMCHKNVEWWGEVVTESKSSLPIQEKKNVFNLESIYRDSELKVLQILAFLASSNSSIVLYDFNHDKTLQVAR
jgi:hypothetical protein